MPTKKPDTRTEKVKQKALKQAELRNLLAERCRIQHIIDNIEKMEDATLEMEAAEFNRLKTANDQRIKLLGKYLPDLKAMELSSNPDNPLFESDEDALNRRLEQLLSPRQGRESGSDKHH